MNAHPTPRPRVLIVEDEYLIRLTLAEALSEEGFDVVEAPNGDAALPMVLADPTIMLLMTDIQMPGALDGRQLADAARKARPGLPVLFMTGRPDIADLAPGTPLNGFVSKPYRLSEICDAVRGLLRTQPSSAKSC